MQKLLYVAGCKTIFQSTCVLYSCITSCKSQIGLRLFVSIPAAGGWFNTLPLLHGGHRYPQILILLAQPSLCDRKAADTNNTFGFIPQFSQHLKTCCKFNIFWFLYFCFSCLCARSRERKAKRCPRRKLDGFHTVC